MSTMKKCFRPEIVLYNGSFSSQDLVNPIQTGVQAIAIADGRIVSLGNNDDILLLADADTVKIDLGGRLVVPGFIDTHIHFYEWALQRQALQLEGLRSLEDLLRLVKADADRKKPGEWIMGQGWNETDWNEGIQPNRYSLDEAAPGHPVLLWRCDLHLAVANSAALQLAGIDGYTPDPPEGLIERDSSGKPTGALRELAINIVRHAISPPDEQHLDTAFSNGIKALHQLGITGIHDIRLMSDSDGARSLQTFEKMDLNNELPLRCWMSLPGHKLENIIDLGLRTGFGSDRLRLGHVKFFADGGFGARTAWMIEPFLDAGYGMPLVDMAALAQDIKKADAAGLSVMVHAVGDRANRELLTIFEGIEVWRRKNRIPAPPIPHRIEHAQMVRPEDIARLRNLNLALCVTPVNMILDINLIDKALGESGKWTYSFRQLLDTGSPVMFSSDCPVCDPAPMPAIHAAVTRQRFDSTPADGWYPESCITTAEALNAFTSVPAAVHNYTDIGRILPDCRADLAILSNNIFTSPPSALMQTKVEMTLFEGQIVHRLF